MVHNNNISVGSYSLMLLKRYFMWPKDHDTTSWYYLKAFLATTYFSLLWIGCSAHYINAKIYQQNAALEDDLVTLVSIMSLTFVCFSTVIHQKDLAEALEHLSNFDDFGKPEDFDQTEARMNLLSKRLFYGNMLGILLNSLDPIVEISRCQEYFSRRNISEVCGLLAPVYLPFNINYTPMNQLYSILQISSLVVGMVPSMAIAVLAVVIHEHVCCRIRHLKAQGELIGRSQKTVAEELKKFIKQHQYTIWLMNKVNQGTSVALCTHVFLTSSVIAVIAQQLTHLAWRTPIGPIMHINGWILALFINCYGGQLILDESSTIGDSIYLKTEWYTFETKIQKDIFIIITRCKQPLVARTGAFGHMSLPLFLMVLKGTYFLIISSYVRSVGY